MGDQYGPWACTANPLTEIVGFEPTAVTSCSVPELSAKKYAVWPLFERYGVIEMDISASAYANA